MDTRTNDEKRDARLKVVSASLMQFKARREALRLHNEAAAELVRFSDVWKAYWLVRPCFWAKGDESGVRAFVPEIFTKMLNRVEADAEKAARDQNSRELEEAAQRVGRSADNAMRDLISRMTPEDRESRKRSILNEIEGLAYKPWGVAVRPLREKLDWELSLLKELDPKPEPISKAILRQEMVDSLNGLTGPSPELIELRERGRIGLGAEGALAITAVNFGGR